MLKRLLDIVLSITALILLFPFLGIIGILVAITSKGGVFYSQSRVGLHGHEFWLYKFRTMHSRAEGGGLLTVGARDPRITGFGYFLRKYKLDELPQLFNVLTGSMSLVGPRPEVRKYVSMYNDEQRKVLLVKPGLTDYASLEYFNESELLSASPSPEETYIKEVMPAKLALNMRYIKEANLLTDLKIIARTVGRIFRGS